jgi:hypothetical protein
MSNKKSITLHKLNTAFRMHRKFLTVLNAGDRFDRWLQRGRHWLSEFIIDTIDIVTTRIAKVLGFICWALAFPFLFVRRKFQKTVRGQRVFVVELLVRDYSPYS